jgi:type VI secretion system protein ImpL
VEEAQTSREDQVAQLESLYFENYIKEWKGFIGAIYVAPIDDYLDAQRVFEDLTHGATPPLKRLAQYVDYHTTLPAAPEPESEKDLAEEGLERGAEVLAKKGGKAGKAAGAAKKLLAKDDPARAGNPLLQTRSDIKAAFEGLARFGYVPQPPVAEGQPAPPPPAVPLDRYQEELARVRDAIRAKIDHDGPDEAKALANAVKSARTTVDSIINETDTQGWRSTFMKWLPPPFESVWRLVNESVTGVIAKNWCEDVYKPLQARVFSRRPFAKTGRDLSLDVFAEFFRPEEGAVWTYYGSALTGAIPRKHGTYGVAKSGAADRTQYNPALVGFLNRAHDLAAVLFPTGSDTMLVEIDVWIGDNDKAAETSLTIDGMKVSHRNGPGRWQRMRWPGEGDKRGGFIETKGRLVRGEVEREGNWGLFELLGVGTLKSGSADTDVFTVRWDLRDQEAGIVTIKFRPLEADSPFFGVREHGLEFMQIFKHPDLLSPPAQIILGSSTCGGI